MKITIDTTHDSETDIRKVIALLSTLLDRNSTSASMGSTGMSAPDAPTAADGNSIFSMFDTTLDSPASAHDEITAQETNPAKEKEEPFKIVGLERY
ncbi:MAG: hypothetical protein Q7R76_04810 [Candidatus Woesearchaeota archaeon]|nr:hypothetical protein [Candidatus Woesearchaeota archaeon]